MKMKKSVRNVLILFLVLCIGLLSACGQTSSKDKSASTEKKKITIFNRLNPEVNVEDNAILKQLEEKLNVEIEYIAPPINNYKEKEQITMASNDLPDIIYNWGGADSYYESWAKQGLIVSLDDYLNEKDYPNIMSTITSQAWDAIKSTEDGKIYSIPRLSNDGYWGFLINQTWLDNLGLKAPTTLDEFKAVCHAFTYDDPDKNGKDDTYGFGLSLGSSGVDVNALKYSFGLVDAKDSNGNYATLTRKDGFIPYLTFFKDLQDDGTIDPEFFTNEVYAHEEKLIAQKVGIIPYHSTGALIIANKGNLPLDTFTYIGALENQEGKRMEYVTPAIWGTWMISKDADVEACLKLIDYCMSDEGFALMYLGIKGEHYNSYDFKTRTVDRTPEQIQKLASVSSSYFTFTFAKDGLTPIIEGANTQEAIDKYYKEFNAMKDNSETVYVPLVRSKADSEFKENNPDLVTKLSNLEIKYIVGEISEADFKDFLTKEYYPASEAAEEEYVSIMKELDK